MPSDNHPMRLLLGIGGGVAAYNTIELVRHLRFLKVEIIPVLTANAQRFVTPTALQAVAGCRPHADLWDAGTEAGMGHIELARWADVVLVAPATANLIARLAAGLADDLLTTLCLATEAPLFLAPAMNTKMWEHPATVRNIARLRADGATVLGPADGEQACGELGLGRMVEPADLAAALLAAEQPGALAGRNVLVTAGPTREFLDPVRFISNRSSGRQGFALAEAARSAGARVTLVAGPVQLPTPAGVERVDVTSALEMRDAVLARAGGSDIVFAVAAVADYRPRDYHKRKLAKTECRSQRMPLSLRENPDIVTAVAAATPRPFVVGFAAETHDAIAKASGKRRSKGLDAIVVNDVSAAGIGFDGPDNAVTLIHAQGEVALPKMSKLGIAKRLIAEVAPLCSERQGPRLETTGAAP